MVCHFPGDNSVPEFWPNICASVDSITGVPAVQGEAVVSQLLDRITGC
jgi:acyl transferase domain-containing protein